MIPTPDVDHRVVLVGASEAVDAELPVLALGIETEINPQARRFDVDFRETTVQGSFIAGHGHIAIRGGCDIGIDVIWGGAGRVIGRSFVAIDRPPWIRCPTCPTSRARFRASGSWC